LAQMDYSMAYSRMPGRQVFHAVFAHAVLQSLRTITRAFPGDHLLFVKRNMTHRKIIGLSLATLLVSCSGWVLPGVAQNTVSRLTAEGRAAVRLSAASTALPAGAVDEGAASSGTRLERMLLLLQLSASQTSALSSELAALNTQSSANYHQWLSAAEFAAAYSNSPTDVAAVAAWLSGQGFQVAALPSGLGWIEFSGTVDQVQQAFGATVEQVSVAGTTRYKVNGSVSVPTALAPVVAGLVSLDGTLSTAAATSAVAVNTSLASLKTAGSLREAEAITPSLAGNLLNWTTLHQQGTTGVGESIAIAARSNLLSGDVSAFRAAFGLPAGTLTVTTNGSDPGLTSDAAATTMMAEWAGAAASGAKIVVVPASTTAATDGVDLALAAIVDQKLATTAVVGYSLCESSASAAHQAFYSALYRQAAAEGISIVAAAGDAGAAGCAATGTTAAVSSGYGVNALASTPWSTAVSATGFSSTERTALAAWAQAGSAEPVYASGGGSSRLYTLPSWQATAKATAASVATSAKATAMSALSTGERLLPDLALPTASDSNGNPGVVVCQSSSAAGSSCNAVRIGGSAAAAAIFAGVSAMVEQSHGMQGALNNSLYAMRSNSAVYSDIVEGSATLHCVAGSSDCNSTQQIGYSAATGYDLTSGLGSVNAQGMVKYWAESTGTTVSKSSWYSTSSPIKISLNGAATLKVEVVSDDSTVTTTPTGTVAFYYSTTASGAGTELGTSTLSSGIANYTIAAGTLSAGTYYIYATYNGSTVYATSTTSTITLVVSSKIGTSTALTASSTTITAGGSIVLKATVTPDELSDSEAYPKGSVEFLSGTSIIGTATLSEVGSSDVSSASLTVAESSTLAAGTDTVTAYYVGDTYYASSTSNAISLTVQDFTISFDSSTSTTGLTITKGGSGTASFDLAAVGGFSDSINVVCTVPSNVYMTCSVSPQKVTLPTTVTLTVKTFTSGSVSTSRLQNRPLWATGGTALALLGFFLMPFGRKMGSQLAGERGRKILLLLLLGGVGLVGVGCNSTSGTSSTGTPLGQTTLTITAMDAVDTSTVYHTIYLPVNVVSSNN